MNPTKNRGTLMISTCFGRYRMSLLNSIFCQICWIVEAVSSTTVIVQSNSTIKSSTETAQLSSTTNIPTTSTSSSMENIPVTSTSTSVASTDQSSSGTSTTELNKKPEIDRQESGQHQIR